MSSLTFFISKGGELLYYFCYLVSCMLVIFMLFYEWRRTGTRHNLYLLYAFAVMLINLFFSNVTLAQEIFFNFPRSNFWYPIITWNLQALSLIFITGAFIYPVAHKKSWLQKYISYNIIILVFSFFFITPLWLNSYFAIQNYNQFWGAYYYNTWLCLLLAVTVTYLHFSGAKLYPDILLRAFLGLLLFNQVIKLWVIVFPNTVFLDYLIFIERTLPLAASFLLVMTIYKSIVHSLVESNQKLDIIRQQLDQSNQGLEKKVLERTWEISEANKEILRFKEFHENILESLTNGILAVGSDGRIMALNRAAENNLKVKNSVVAGKELKTVFPPPEGVKWEELIEEVVSSGREIVLNKLYCNLPQLEEEVVVNVIGQPLKDKELHKIGVVLTLEFITEKVLLEDKVKRTEKLAYMGEIAAGVAHEIRNPLNSISINLQLLRRTLLKDKDKNENTDYLNRFKIISSEISRLDGIVNEFIQFARPKKIKLQKKNINKIMESILALIAEQAALARVVLNKELDRQIPSSQLDESQIKQVLLNISINSMQAMPRGGGYCF